MADRGARQEISGWSWVRQVGRLGLGGCLTFVRGATPQELIRAFGMSPADAQVLLGTTAGERYPPGSPPWIRVGETSGWTFAIEEISLMGSVEGIAQNLSSGTEAATVDWTAKPTCSVAYFVDRTVITMFDSTMPWSRSGREPDRFLAEMRELGMPAERPEVQPAPSREEYLARRRQLAGRRCDYRDPVSMSLAMLAIALGIRLPEEVVRGPLLTISRDDAV